jgi:hypothetical protein
MGVSGKPQGGIYGTLAGYFRKAKRLQVGPLALLLAFGGVDSGTAADDPAAPGASSRSGAIRTISAVPAASCRVMSQVLAGGQDYSGVIDGSHW